MDEVPFRTVYLHGLVADEKGQKMSKSKGNSIDPLETIDTYGTDAFRFALANASTPNPYVSLPESQIESGRRFANKIWNAARFILMNLEKHPITAGVKVVETEQEPLEITWIRSRLSHTIKTTTEALENFRFHEAAQTLYAFLWHEFCDWYLEFAKQRIAQDKPEALWVAADVLEQTMRLLHPLMPFLTEEIWQQLLLNGTSTTSHEDASVAIAAWPEPKGENSTAETTMATLMEVIESIRSIRGELNVPIGAPIEVHIQSPNSEARERLETYLAQYLPAFTRVAGITIAKSLQKPPASAEAVIGELAIYIPLADVIDLDAEHARLSKRHQQATKDVVSAQKTLDNPNFVQRAPEKVVAQKKAQLERLLIEQEKLARSLAMLTESGGGI
jgi:valyl-tRNA synthetase